MFFEVAITICVLVFGLLKFVFRKQINNTSKLGHIVETSQDISEETTKNVERTIIVKEDKNASASRNVVDTKNTISIDTSISSKKIDEPKITATYKTENDNYLVKPSDQLRKIQSAVEKRERKRDSPPKERLSQFLEKTVLQDDKINTILRNLSLDKSSDILDLTLTPIEKETNKQIPIVKNVNNIDINAFNDKINENSNKYLQTDYNDTADFSKKANPFIEQHTTDVKISKNPLIPGGLSFDSVIGELKNKARNGGLKPVFKKFEVDAVDNVQARI